MHTLSLGYSMGVPLVPSLAGLVRGLVPGGKAFFVGSGSGSPSRNAGEGEHPEEPLSALFGANGALAKLNNRQNRGDAVYVLPGHTESVSAADMASHIDTAKGVSIIGLGSGIMRPAFTWTAAAATWLFDTDDIELVNCRLFLAGAHAAGSALTVAAPITVSGNGCRLIGNEVWWGFDADQIVNQGIIWNGDDGVFAGNRCYAETAAVPTATFMTLTAADRMQIFENWIVGATSGTTVGVIRGLTTASVNIEVRDNYMANRLASSTIAFSPLTASTGTARNNRFFVNSGILPITASILDWQENYCVDTAGQAGALVGTASS